jgi:general secretion pathway protein K
MNRRGRRPAQRGATVIAALAVVALVTVLAVHLVERQERWYRQVKLEGDRLQAMALAQAAIDYGRAVLADDERRSAIDHADEVWARPLPPMSVEGGLLGGRIEDLQGRLNLNSLVSGDTGPAGGPAALARLWRQLGLDPGQLAALADWLDSDSVTRYPGGAEDQYYLALAQPYRAANKPLSSLDELLLVRGFDAKVIDRLRPFVAVLPGGTPLNVNTASAEVLAAAIPQLSSEQAEAVRRSGDREPFATPAEFAARLYEFGLPEGPLPQVSASSRHFVVRGEVRWGEASVRMAVGIERQGGGSSPRIVWKSLQ